MKKSQRFACCKLVSRFKGFVKTFKTYFLPDMNQPLSNVSFSNNDHDDDVVTDDDNDDENRSYSSMESGIGSSSNSSGTKESSNSLIGENSARFLVGRNRWLRKGAELQKQHRPQSPRFRRVMKPSLYHEIEDDLNIHFQLTSDQLPNILKELSKLSSSSNKSSLTFLHYYLLKMSIERKFFEENNTQKLIIDKEFIYDPTLLIEEMQFSDHCIDRMIERGLSMRSFIESGIRNREANRIIQLDYEKTWKEFWTNKGIIVSLWSNKNSYRPICRLYFCSGFTTIEQLKHYLGVPDNTSNSFLNLKDDLPLPENCYLYPITKQTTLTFSRYDLSFHPFVQKGGDAFPVYFAKITKPYKLGEAATIHAVIEENDFFQFFPLICHKNILLDDTMIIMNHDATLIQTVYRINPEQRLDDRMEDRLLLIENNEFLEKSLEVHREWIKIGRQMLKRETKLTKMRKHCRSREDQWLAKKRASKRVPRIKHTQYHYYYYRKVDRKSSQYTNEHVEEEEDIEQEQEKNSDEFEKRDILDDNAVQPNVSENVGIGVIPSDRCEELCEERERFENSFHLKRRYYHSRKEIRMKRKNFQKREIERSKSLQYSSHMLRSKNLLLNRTKITRTVEEGEVEV